jgi:hypothetical protein
MRAISDHPGARRFCEERKSLWSRLIEFKYFRETRIVANGVEVRVHAGVGKILVAEGVRLLQGRQRLVAILGLSLLVLGGERRGRAALLDGGDAQGIDARQTIAHAGKFGPDRGEILAELVGDGDCLLVLAQRYQGLNPLDVFDLPGAVVDSNAEMMASLLSVGHQFSRDPFWSDSAPGLVGGLIAHIGTGTDHDKPEERTLNRLC